jgi:hypothetical protein
MPKVAQKYWSSSPEELRALREHKVVTPSLHSLSEREAQRRDSACLSLYSSVPLSAPPPPLYAQVFRTSLRQHLH